LKGVLGETELWSYLVFFSVGVLPSFIRLPETYIEP
jgi:hypothetical protein